MIIIIITSTSSSLTGVRCVVGASESLQYIFYGLAKDREDSALLHNTTKKEGIWYRWIIDDGKMDR
jgi:hypothetical protein